MPTYEYRCARDGPFDALQSVKNADRPARCPTCNEDSARVFSAPMLSRTPRAVRQAVDRADRTREAPEVVGTVPRRLRTAPSAAARNPALRRLPRP